MSTTKWYSQIKPVHCLTRNHEHDETKEDPCDQSMCVVTDRVCDVCKREHIQLLLTTAACYVNGEQNRHRNQAAHEANDDEGPEESEIKIAIERLMCEHMLVREAAEALDPIKPGEVLGTWSTAPAKLKGQYGFP
jgi:hypothetical protein